MSKIQPERVWMAYSDKIGFIPWVFGDTKEICRDAIDSRLLAPERVKAVRVEIREYRPRKRDTT